MGKKATEAGKRFQETATVATRQMQESAKNANISSPLPDSSAAEDLKKAANLLRAFVDKEENVSGFDNIIPPEVLRKAKGLAIYTVVKAVCRFYSLFPQQWRLQDTKATILITVHILLRFIRGLS